MADQELNPKSEIRNANSPWLIVGLGNPGSAYADTYHNVGFRVLARMAERLSARIKDRLGPSLISGTVRLGEKEAVMVLPQTFMNETGRAVPWIFERFESSNENLVVVYDDVALPLGKIRIRRKGSAGGHNGIKSVIAACGSDEFLRVRVGILPDRPVDDVRDFVLSRVAQPDRLLLEKAEVAAADAVETLVNEGAEKTMAVFNRMDLREAKED